MASVLTDSDVRRMSGHRVGSLDTRPSYVGRRRYRSQHIGPTWLSGRVGSCVPAFTATTFVHLTAVDHGRLRISVNRAFIGPIPWGHSGPLCHALSLSSSWTLHAACASISTTTTTPTTTTTR